MSKRPNFLVFDKCVKIRGFELLTYSFMGKSFSEALLFAEHGENMLCTKIVLYVRNNFCTQHVQQKEELLTKIYLWICQQKRQHH